MQAEARDEKVATPRLDYAPRPSRRRQWARRAVLLALLLMVTIAGVRWGPAYFAKARLMYCQRRCLTYVSPADLLVYDQNFDPATQPPPRGDEYSVVPPAGPSAPGAVLAHAPRCWTEFQSLAKATVPWPRGKPPLPGAVLFLHERTSPSGARRLVVLLSNFNPDSPPLFIYGYDVIAAAYRLGNWSQTPVEEVAPVRLSVTNAIPRVPPRVQVFAGQVDPADASHFTIRYEQEGKPGAVDGYLRDGPLPGQTSVKLQRRP